jgi:pyruvate/2-oxoglutarate dehydrogenase complex dihydrolipoamide dehydrogenase (E3) component
VRDVGDAAGDPAAPIVVEPWDRHNQALVANAHPATWENPEPAGRYNLVVLGAGTAGLVAAAGAAGLGARVALIERALMGGDCLTTGCVPSKSLIRAARAAADVRAAGQFGVQVPPGSRVDFGAVMERMRRLRAGISRADAAARFRDLGVDVFFGDARFAAPDAVRVADRTLGFARAVIATGARPAVPPISGLAEAGYLTNETVFGLTELPRRLAVIGAGPIGCELSQAFARFGAEVALFDGAERVLAREDADAAARLAQALRADGVALHLGVRIERVERDGAERIVCFEQGGVTARARVDEILVGVGRRPNVEGLGLDAAGVACDAQTGIAVSDRLRTSNPRIYAAGDVCSGYKFTHNSDAQARIVIQNALFRGRARASALTLPWCTYTDPEIGHVGLGEREARARGIPVRTFVQELADVDRAVLDGEAEGFVKVHVRARGDAIVGATIVARHAGEMLGELTLAMTRGIGLGTLAGVIHPYPTQAEAIRKLGDAYNRTRLTPAIKRLFGTWLRWNRGAWP